MQSKTEKITDVLEDYGTITTGQVAQYANLNADICERVLLKMEDTGQVFAVGDESWQLN